MWNVGAAAEPLDGCDPRGVFCCRRTPNLHYLAERAKKKVLAMALMQVDLFYTFAIEMKFRTISFFPKMQGRRDKRERERENLPLVAS